MAGSKSWKEVNADLQRTKREALDLAQTVALLSDEIPYQRMTTEKAARVQRAIGYMLRMKKRKREAKHT